MGHVYEHILANCLLIDSSKYKRYKWTITSKRKQSRLERSSCRFMIYTNFLSKLDKHLKSQKL